MESKDQNVDLKELQRERDDLRGRLTAALLQIEIGRLGAEEDTFITPICRGDAALAAKEAFTWRGKLVAKDRTNNISVRTWLWQKKQSGTTNWFDRRPEEATPEPSAAPISRHKGSNPWAKAELNLTQQAQIIRADPDLARRLKAEARAA